mmetsp:Transcript_22661/g.54230  ORF Transcript_22661/g.54230 Transcript_22661/m.54230 type:complete len:300 (+) Transcript_22661:70-969(+)
MVVLNVKNSEQERFLFETTVDAVVRDVLQEVVQLHNLRMRVHRLKYEGEELAKYGPAKRLDQQGIDEYQEEAVEKGKFYCQDPTGRRTGNACDPEVSKVWAEQGLQKMTPRFILLLVPSEQVLRKTLESAEQTVHKDNADRKISLTKKMLDDCLDEIRGAVMICYPMGLPEWDPVRGALEGCEELSGTSYASDDLELDKAQLWFAGKQMQPEKLLKDYVGRHEKTKAVVKLQKAGAGPPAREPVVDPETQKAMVAYYHKKQEEMKKLEEDSDDSFLNSSWTNDGSLKKHFAGIGDIRIR